MANTPDKFKSPMSDDDRTDLMAMIAAGRDLPPDMDASLVESYAERRAAEKKARAKADGNAVVPQQPGNSPGGVHPAVAIAGMATMAAIFVTAMVLSGGHVPWLIFPLLFIFGGLWGGHDRHRAKYARRAQRYQMRADYYRARMGYPAREDARRLPEDSDSDSGPLPPPSTAPAQTPPAPRGVPPTSVTPSTDGQPPVNPAG